MLRLCAWSIHFWRRDAAFDQPARFDLERGGVELADVGRDAVDLGQRTVEVLQVGDHDFVPQAQRFRSSTKYSLTTVNSPERLDFT